jgi:hypothetical protein
MNSKTAEPNPPTIVHFFFCRFLFIGATEVHQVAVFFQHPMQIINTAPLIMQCGAACFANKNIIFFVHDVC